jgi:hypothetical protein
MRYVSRIDIWPAIATLMGALLLSTLAAGLGVLVAVMVHRGW